MAEQSKKLSDVACIQCFGCGEDIVIDRKATSTDYECCCCSSLMTVKFFKNGKMNVKMKKKVVKKDGE